MKSISIQQPWAQAILLCGKDVENRTWKTNFRGPVLIHASKRSHPSNWIEFQDKLMYVQMPNAGMPDGFWDCRFGGIIGQVDIVDCVDKSASPWFVGPFGFVLRNPRILPFRPCKGALGFFNPKL